MPRAAGSGELTTVGARFETGGRGHSARDAGLRRESRWVHSIQMCGWICDLDGVSSLWWETLCQAFLLLFIHVTGKRTSHSPLEIILSFIILFFKSLQRSCLCSPVCFPAASLSLPASVARELAFWNVSWGFISPLDLSQLPLHLPFLHLFHPLQWDHPKPHIFCEAFAFPVRTSSCHTFLQSSTAVSTLHMYS